MSEQNGFGRIAVSNQYMVAWTLLYMCLVDRSLEMAAHAVNSAVRAGQPRSEMVARLTAARSLFENGQYDEAGIHVERGMAIVDTLQASRFEAFFLIFRVRLAHAEKHIDSDSIRELNAAISQSRESGFGFLGPWLLSTLALVSSDPDIRSQALAEGEAVLEAGCVGHNYFAFYENAMEISRNIGNFDEAERYADALESYMHADPLPLSLFHIDLTRTLINYHHHSGDKAVIARLHQLQNQASSAGLNHTANTLQHFLVQSDS